MPPQDKIKAGIDRELRTMEILLTTKINRTAITLEGYIALRQAQGASLATIKSGLLADLETGGRMFGEFRNSMRATYAGSTSRFSDIGITSETGIEKSFRWVAVLENTCPDCLDRHGQIMSWEDWEQIGLPKTGATICMEHCKCVLITAEASEMEPVYRSKR